MMKVKILFQFRDRYDRSVVYRVGDEKCFDEKRALTLIEHGLVESLERTCNTSEMTNARQECSVEHDTKEANPQPPQKAKGRHKAKKSDIA